MHDERGERWIELGVLGRPRGLGGAIWFRSYNDLTEAVTPGRRLRVVDVNGATRSLVVADLETEAKGIVLRFAGVADRSAAEALVNARVSLQRKDFPPLDEDEYYHCDIPGMRVLDANGVELGEVLGVEAYPTVDALRVRIGEEELEVPITAGYVLALDVDAGRVTVDLDALRAE